MFYLAAYVALMLARAARGRNAYLLIVAALFLLSAFRFEVGCDWRGYLNQFYRYQDVGLYELLDQQEPPSWVALFVLQHGLGLPYPWINVVSSAIFFYGAHVLAKRQPDPLGFMILLFPVLIINMPMSGIRQGAAIGLMCLAFVAFIEQRTLRFIGWTSLAASFHSSAALFFLISPLVGGKLSKARLLGSGLLVIPGALTLISTQSAELATSRYVETSIDAAGAAFRVGLLAVTGLSFLLFLRHKWADAFPKDYRIIVLCSCMMMGLVGVVGMSSVIGDRLGYYLIPIQAMILARLPSFRFQTDPSLLIAAPYAALFVVLASWTTLSGLFQECYVPYQTWLFGFPEARYYMQ